MDIQLEKKFIEEYDASQYKKMSVAVDILIFTVQDKHLEVLLVKREEFPFKDCLALPGTFVGEKESLDDAVKRCLQEEIGITDMYTEQLYTWGEVERDPRLRVLSVSYVALVNKSKCNPKAGKRVTDVCWMEVSMEHMDAIRNQMAFDHAKIIQCGLERLRGKIEYAPIVFHMLEDEFTLPQLQSIYEIILGKKLYKANFRKKIMDMVVETGNIQSGEANRPSKYYCWKDKIQEKEKML